MVPGVHALHKKMKFSMKDFFSHWWCPVKKVFKACKFVQKRLQHRCFPVNIAKYFEEHLRKAASVFKKSLSHYLSSLP